MMTRALALGIVFVTACQPRDKTTDEEAGGRPGMMECVSTLDTETTCDDAEDNDCDGYFDCDDPDCSGVGSCPICGEATHLEGEPLALPDDGTGTSAYISAILIRGFGDGQVLNGLSDFKGVCVNMEHSWLRDLQIELMAPNGQIAVLQRFLGQEGSEVYMGQPNDDDTDDPVPGMGADYCWTPTAMNPPMLDYCNANATHDLPPTDYQAVSGFDMFVSTPLNGHWQIKVTDLWSIDNGYIFSWGVNFDPQVVGDCSNPID